jgi:hypothetical protein
MVAAAPEPSGWARGQVNGEIVQMGGKPLTTSCSMPPHAVAGKLAGMGLFPSQVEAVLEPSSMVMFVGTGEPPSPTVSPASTTSFVPFGPTRSSWTPARFVDELTPLRVSLTLVTAPLSPVTLMIDGYGVPWDWLAAVIAAALVHVAEVAEPAGHAHPNLENAVKETARRNSARKNTRPWVIRSSIVDVTFPGPLRPGAPSVKKLLAD